MSRLITSRASTGRIALTPLRLFALTVLIFVAMLSLFHRLLPFEPYATVNLTNAFARPSLAEPFGTDNLGRSIVSGVVEGAPSVLLIVFATVLPSALLGFFLGMLAGYVGGLVDQVIMRTADVLLSFPAIFLALALVAVMGAGLESAILGIGITMVAPFARLVRGEVLEARQSEYVLNARSVGASGSRILLVHIFPNIVGPMTVQITFAAGTAILGVAALGFLGVGAQPPSADWGTMIFENQLYVVTAPHTVIFPGLAIFAVVCSFNILGEWLHGKLDPRSTKREGLI
jgi:peptide/nickel transport system permease protein